MTVETQASRPVTPFAGWMPDAAGRPIPAETAPHIGIFAPPGTGKTRRVLAPAAVLWPGPALVSSSKDDLMQMVASRRYGPAVLLDLRPITAPYYPKEFQRCRFDPTMLIESWDDAQAVAETLLSMSAVALSGGSFRSGSDPGPWDDLAFAPLTCLLFAASPLITGAGMEWALAAAEDVSLPKTQPGGGIQVSTAPCWYNAATLSSEPLFEARVRGILDMEAKQRDSVKITVSRSLTAWLRTARRDKGLPAFDPRFLDDPHTTVYLLTPAGGTVAPQAITLIDQLINRQRVKTAQWEEFARLGMFLDEITNTPLPRLPQYVAESRGLGVSIVYAAQASSQLDAMYGPLQGKAIREVTPATLIMYGAHEEELMRSAAFWAGKTTRSSQSLDHDRGPSTSRTFGNAMEPEELSPANLDQARLIVRGTPGRTLRVLDWREVVPIIDSARTTLARSRNTVSRRAAS